MIIGSCGVVLGMAGTLMFNKSFGGNEDFPVIMSGQSVSGSVLAMKNFSWYDFWSDESLTKFISKDFDFNAISYVPQDLISINTSVYIYAPAGAMLRKQAAQDLKLLAKDFYKRFQIQLIIVSAYRSYDYQEQLVDTYKKRMGTWKTEVLSARPWHSEHQAWLAIDIFSPSTETEFFNREDYKIYYNRFKKNAHRYGFHQSYQRGKELDGYLKEPRHRRYVWKELATRLYQEKKTFTQFFEEQVFGSGVLYDNLYQ